MALSTARTSRQRYCRSMRIVLLAFLSAIVCIHGLPMIVIDSDWTKCVWVESSMGSGIRIFYDAPDIPLDKSEPKYAPTYLTVNIKPAIRAVDAKHPLLEQLRPTNQLLTERRGNVTHRFEVDGSAAVCVRSASATKEIPHRFGLRVVMDESTNLLGKIPPHLDNPEGVTTVMRHLSSMTVEIQRIGFSMRKVLAEADFAKERDSVFHKQTQEMDEATIFWPVVQVCVLLMTGFAQASHIVRFFKSRRIL